MYSLIFHKFEGRFHDLQEAFRIAFGDSGVSFALAFDREAKHRPCELLTNLTQENAERKAAILRESGATIEVLQTTEVSDVKHRADECWPTHRASNGETFTQWDELIVSGASLSLREQVAQQRTESPTNSLWRFELGYNHEHPTHSDDRHGLRTAREYGADLASALTECFPDRRFLLDYRGSDLSFCQFTEEHPVGISPGERRVVDLRVPKSAVDVCYCEVCERATGYVLRTEPDAEFPNAQFADCIVCGNEVVLWIDNEIVLVESKAR